MPFQQINYAAIPPVGMPGVANLVQSLAQGYMAGQMPAQMQRQAQAQNLANQLNQLRLQQEPQTFAEDLKAKQLSNAMNNLLFQEQPDVFKGNQAATALANQLKQLQINAAKRTADPEAAAQYFTQIANIIKGMQNSQNSPNAGATATGATSPLGTVPTANMPSFGQQGYGVIAPAGDNSSPTNNLTITPDQAKNLSNAGIGQPALVDPVQMMKNFFGIKPTPAEIAAQKFNEFKAQEDYKKSLLPTPEQKEQTQLDVFNKKLQDKAQQATPAFATKQQTAINAINTVMPGIDKLINMTVPNQIFGKYLTPSDQAAYVQQLNLNKDTLIKGLGLNPNDKPIQLIDQILRLAPLEMTDKYRARLLDLKNDLSSRQAEAIKSLKPGYFTNPPATASSSSSNVPAAASSKSSRTLKVDASGNVEWI